jgi:hypothetical protein
MHPVGIVFDHNDRISQVRKTAACDQSHISRPDNGQLLFRHRSHHFHATLSIARHDFANQNLAKDHHNR